MTPGTALCWFALLLMSAWVPGGWASKYLPDSVVCPRYFSTPGDTLDSVAVVANADVSSVALSIEACGGRVSPISLGMLCLPGGEYQACKHVKNFRDNPRCAYYVVQSGDTASIIASNLNIYLPDIERVNQGVVSVDQLNPGEVLKLPPWDLSFCGASLPKTDAEVQALPPAPPPPVQNLVGAGGGQGGQDNVCEAYRAQPWDSIFTVASSFSIPIGTLMAMNPDYSNGKVVTGGSIIVLQNPGGEAAPCTGYDFREGFGEIGTTVNLSPPALPPPPPGPVRLGLVTDANPQIINENVNITATDEEAVDYELRADEDQEDGMYNGRPIFSNIVTDQTEATEPPSGSGPSVGIYIMIGALSVVVLLVLIIISMAVSNSGKRLGNASHERKPPERSGKGLSGSGSSDLSTPGSSKMSDTSGAKSDPINNV